MTSENEFIRCDGNQTISLLFEMQSFNIILDKHDMTINELKQQFFQQVFGKEKQMDPESYELQELTGIRYSDEKIVQDIITTIKSNIFKLVKALEMREDVLIEQQKPINTMENNDQQLLNLDQEYDFNDEYDSLLQQNYYEQNQDIDQSTHFHIIQFDLVVLYKQVNISLFKIQNKMNKCKYLKKIIASELQALGIIINSDFCELLDQDIVIPDDQEIIPRYKQKIILVDQKRLLQLEPNFWGQCLIRKEQIHNQLANSQKFNEKANLKITLDSWKKKEKSLFKIFPLVSTPNISRIFIIGPKNTPYSDGIYEQLCKIPEEYPFQPPQFYFTTQIYHPNIVNGALTSLELSWKPQSTLESVILQIMGYLRKPNYDYILNNLCALQYQKDRDAYNQVALGWNKNYANPDLDDIIKSLFGCVYEFNPFYDELLEDFEEWIIHWVHQSR